MNIGTFTNVCVSVAAALWLLLCFGWPNWLIFTIIEPVHPSSTTAAMGRVAAHARARGTKYWQCTNALDNVFGTGCDTDWAAKSVGEWVVGSSWKFRTYNICVYLH